MSKTIGPTSKHEDIKVTYKPYSMEWLNQLLRKRTYIDIVQLTSFWSMPGRHYHDIGHAAHLFDLLRENKIHLDPNSELAEDLALAIMFHDAIYVPGSSNNEVMSASLWLGVANASAFEPRAKRIYEAIILTEYSKYSRAQAEVTSDLALLLRRLDLYDLLENTDDSVVQTNFENVYAEFKHLVNLKQFFESNTEYMNTLFINEGRPELFISYYRTAEKKFKEMEAEQRKAHYEACQ